MMTWKTYIVTQALGMAAFNAACNAAYTWYLWRNKGVLHFDAIGADLELTPVWIGLLSVLLGTPFIRKALADGRMMRDAGIRASRLGRFVPRHLLLRGVAAAAVCAPLFSFPLALALPLMGDGEITAMDAIGTKVIITLGFSLMIVPLVVFITAHEADKAEC